MGCLCEFTTVCFSSPVESHLGSSHLVSVMNKPLSTPLHQLPERLPDSASWTAGGVRKPVDGNPILPKRKHSWYHHPSKWIAGRSQALDLSDRSHQKPVVQGMSWVPHAWMGPHDPGREAAWEEGTRGRGLAAPRDLAQMCHRRRLARPGTGILPACFAAGVLGECPRGSRWCSPDLCISG